MAIKKPKVLYPTMPIINKSVEPSKITYTTRTDSGDILVVVQKTADGTLKYSMEYTGTGDRPTWEDFCPMIEGDGEVNLL